METIRCLEENIGINTACAIDDLYYPLDHSKMMPFTDSKQLLAAMRGQHVKIPNLSTVVANHKINEQYKSMAVIVDETLPR